MDTGDTPNIEPNKPVDNRRPDGTFGPGNIANPNGRPPKELAISDTIRAMMNEKPEIKRALSAKLIEMALKGDLAAIREVMDRIEGKPLQRSETDLTTLGKEIQYLPSELLNKYGLNTSPDPKDSSTG